MGSNFESVAIVYVSTFLSSLREAASPAAAFAASRAALDRYTG